MFFTSGLVRFIIGPGDKNFSDGERFLLKAKTFKNFTGLSEGLAIKTTQGITIILTILLVALLFWFLNKTKTGKSMRAYSDNEELALLSGINPERIVLITWIITGTLACVAGTLYGLDKSYKPFTYLQLVLPIFAAAIVGGVGNPIGAIIGGFVVAFSELLVTFAYKKIFFYLFPVEIIPNGLLQILSTDYKIAVSFIILVLVLLIKPTGIYKGKII
jgi:branched-chain amino acid transport system permease protein